MARVSRTILRLARETSELSGLTHQELADATGPYRETVTNVLNRLQSPGVIGLGTKNITILDLASLEKASET